MAVKTFIDEDGEYYVTDDNGVVDLDQNGSQDFVSRDYDAEYAQTQQNVVDEEKLSRKRKIKTDVVSVLATGLINSIPLITDALKHKNDPVPHRADKKALTRLGISMILPTIKALDTIALNGKVQSIIEEKTPFTFSDITNVVNIVQAYPSTHRVVKDFMSNVSRQTSGQQQIPIPRDVTTDMWISCGTIVSPYICEKITDDRLSFIERCTSIIPLKIFGSTVKKFAAIDPKLQRGYDVLATTIRVADFGNRNMSSIIRPNHGSRNGAANTFGSILDIAQDAMGMSRGNISAFGHNDYWGGGSRFNNY